MEEEEVGGAEGSSEEESPHDDDGMGEETFQVRQAGRQHDDDTGPLCQGFHTSPGHNGAWVGGVC